MSQKTLNGFNTIAPVYDALARLVYGESIVKSQTRFFARLEKARHILIMGGGSGWIVEELMKHTKAEVVYVEASSTMIALARKRNFPINQITFIHGTEEDIPAGRVFDVVITNFYLDLFTEEQQQEVINKILSSLSAKGLWLVSDFVKSDKAWHQFLLFTMHQFFRRFSKMEARSLADWEAALYKNGLTPTQTESFYNGFIKSAVFVKR